VLGVRCEPGRGDQVDRQHEFHAPALRVGHDLRDLRDLVRFEQRVADLVALGREERVRHAAADQHPVGPVQQVRDHRQLVGRLSAAQHDHIRPLRRRGELGQHLDLGPDQVTGRVRDQGRDVVHAGVLAVHRAEAVADVEVGEGGQPAGERGPLGIVLARLGRLEPDVLQECDIGVAQPRDGPRRVLPGHVGRKGHRPPQQLAEALGDRPQRGAARGPLGEAVTLGPPEVRDDNHAGAPLGQLPDHGQAGPDPAVVGDPGITRIGQVQRHVQVGPEQDPPPADLQIVDGFHVGVMPRYESREATSAVRSARRLE
jgi:hypothetical protein